MLGIIPITSQSRRFWAKRDIPPEPASKALMRNHQLLLGHTGSPSTVAEGADLVSPLINVLSSPRKRNMLLSRP